MLLSGRIGAIRSISVRAGWPRMQYYYDRNNWAGQLRAGGNWVLDGPANNALAHQVANMLLLASDRPDSFAEPVAVRGELYSAGGHPSHDTAAIEIATAGGPMLYWLGSHCTEGYFQPTIEVVGDAGRAEWRMRDGARIFPDDGDVEEIAYDFSQHDRMVDNFLDAIEADDAGLLRCPLAQAGRMTAVIDGAHESAGRIEPIPSPPAERIAPGDPNGRTLVRGLDEALIAAAKQGCLLSDLDSAPAWAVATERFDLSGYASFPQRFEA
jgi:predicted dehydrogenase